MVAKAGVDSDDSRRLPPLPCVPAFGRARRLDKRPACDPSCDPNTSRDHRRQHHDVVVVLDRAAAIRSARGIACAISFGRHDVAVLRDDFAAARDADVQDPRSEFSDCSVDRARIRPFDKEATARTRRSAPGSKTAAFAPGTGNTAPVPAFPSQEAGYLAGNREPFRTIAHRRHTCSRKSWPSRP